ncbi:C3HC4-type RING zinc finger protein [Melia azedarach]|uniref:C3HC4-type RING zinc finger protein n=1 Tax=Melia azedarach TaxID=155640 RepID=A0ACC1XHU9_MELAZ|nr:C3HC4-type RING zinc finger protein [Melia azedarach]
MGLSNFPSAAEGVLPVLVMNTVLSVALLKNMVRSVLQVMGATGSNSASNLDDDSDGFINSNSEENARERRISITQFKYLCDSKSNVTSSNSSSSTGWALTTMDCCVCLNGFQADEEVSELSCKHFFHKGCLDKWFDNKHSTCPLCRSIL